METISVLYSYDVYIVCRGPFCRGPRIFSARSKFANVEKVVDLGFSDVKICH